jgi:MFS family permease
VSRTAIILAVFFAHAVAGGSIFARIPDIQQSLDLSEGMLGLALTAASVGGLAANLVAGRTVKALGVKALLAWGIPAMAVFSALAAFATSLPQLLLALLMMGVAFSLANVAMNVEADRVEAAEGRRVMNRCHGIWSAGMLAASMIGVWARAEAIGAGVHLAGIVPVIGVIAIFAIARMDPSPEAPGDKADRAGIALPSRRTVLLVLFGLSGGVCQVGSQNFSVIFMRDSFAAADWVDTLTLPAFLVSMTAGRMLADGWSERHGPVRLAFALALLALSGVVLVVVSGSVAVALAGFALIGLGTSALFPLTISAAARYGNRPAAESVSAVIFLTGLIMLLAPGLMGWIGEAMGQRAIFAAMIPPILVTLLLCRQLAPEGALKAA